MMVTRKQKDSAVSTGESQGDGGGWLADVLVRKRVVFFSRGETENFYKGPPGEGEGKGARASRGN